MEPERDATRFTESSSYVVNVMHTALLLVVLFERVVAVELPDETVEHVMTLNDSAQQIYQIWMNCKRLNVQTHTYDHEHQKTTELLCLLVPHDVVIDLHQGRGGVQPTEVGVYYFNGAAPKKTVPVTHTHNTWC